MKYIKMFENFDSNVNNDINDACSKKETAMPKKDDIEITEYTSSLKIEDLIPDYYRDR